jgi:uncharacterized membrane protein
MNRKRYKQVRVIVALFVAAIISLASMQNSYLLAITGVVTGMIFMAFVRSKARIKIDERETTLREKAAQMTYAIFAPTIGIAAFILLIPYKSISSVFKGGEFTYLESLGMVFAYLTLFLIAIYSICYHYLNRKYGGGNDEE